MVETAPLTLQMVDAAAMADAFAEDGSIALYGIYFDTDKAEIKPESAPTICRTPTPPTTTCRPPGWNWSGAGDGGRRPAGPPGRFCPAE